MAKQKSRKKNKNKGKGLPRVLNGMNTGTRVMKAKQEPRGKATTRQLVEKAEKEF